ncbi:FLYWCH-type zinc finger-containing protein 1-like [Stegodyphus dumicola]|uniref:FLYWCH-type zinc finger-containing protein 1-like n=1 Tax=Stegodyphus dumicola TaxID=202533 RepID=UPI0015B25BBB|nr:FLYWCH-type zinc finger-containing protein 1-like [Stegodyphus dumicola]
MPLHYIISQKNRKQLMVKGYIYNFERASAEKSIWKCVEYFTCKCKGRIHTQDDNIILEKSHGHPPNAGKITAKEIMSSIKERAVTTQESTHSLAAVGTIGLPCAVFGAYTTSGKY